MKKLILALAVMATLVACSGPTTEATAPTVDSTVVAVDSVSTCVDSTAVDTCAVN